MTPKQRHAQANADLARNLAKEYRRDADGARREGWFDLAHEYNTAAAFFTDQAKRYEAMK